MTSARMSMIFRPENEYKDGGSGNWYAPPPGTTWTDTFSRANTKIKAIGSKTWEAVSYGKISASFTWKFTLDYNYLEPLCFIYENWYDGKALDVDKSYDASTGRFKKVELQNSTNTHIFYKSNANRVKSFCARVITLHRLVGGEYDEVRIIRGCVSKGADYSQNASAISVSMSGIAATQDVYYVKAESTDYIPYSDESLVEWACYLQDGEDYVKTVESVSFKTGVATDSVYGSCGPLGQNYTEGDSTYSMNLTAYTDDYNKFKTRLLFTGGDVFTGDFEEIGTDNVTLGKKFTPATRGLKTMKKAVLQSSTTDMVAQMADEFEGDDGSGASQNGNAFSFYDYSGTDGAVNADAGQKSNAVKVTMFNGLITNSAEWKGEAGSKLTESLNMEGNMMVLEFRNANARIWRNVVKASQLAWGEWGTAAQGRVDTAITIPDPTYVGCTQEVPQNSFKGATVKANQTSDTDCATLDA